jgi:hypothetical protein
MHRRSQIAVVGRARLVRPALEILIRFGRTKCREAKRLKQFEDQDQWLKLLLADQALGNLNARAHLERKMASLSRRRATVLGLRSKLDVSEQRLCTEVVQPRTSQQFDAEPWRDEVSLVKQMLKLTRLQPRDGYRRIAGLLREE